MHTWYDVMTHVMHTWYDIMTHVMHTWYDVMTHVMHTWYDIMTHVMHTWLEFGLALSCQCLFHDMSSLFVLNCTQIAISYL